MSCVRRNLYLSFIDEYADAYLTIGPTETFLGLGFSGTTIYLLKGVHYCVAYHEYRLIVSRKNTA